MARAIILAAGRGERMRPLTDAMPKPLLRVGGRALIEWQVERLAAGGFDDLVVNHSHLGELIERALGDGSRFGVRIRYSHEPRALETAGGIVQALPLLGTSPFAVVSGDIHALFDYSSLVPRIEAIAADPARQAAHFVLVDNPPYHPKGDMGLTADRVTRAGPTLTYANIAVYHPQLFEGVAAGTPLKLFPWAYRFVEEGRVTGELYRGPWDNLGTPEQLAALDRELSRKESM
jgi:MurNAc alpha-1-phosphate uridylyltransferase